MLQAKSDRQLGQVALLPAADRHKMRGCVLCQAPSSVEEAVLLG
jgi:hypothetical protein